MCGRRPRGATPRRRLLGDGLAGLQAAQDLVDHHLDRRLAQPQRDVELVGLPEAHLLDDLQEQRRAGHPLARQARFAQALLERLAALVLGVLAPLAAEELADLRARLGGLDEVQPVARRRARGLRGEDLDEVPRLERVGERHDAAVDLRADAAVADVRVDVVGEVEGRRAGRQVAHLALGREHVDLVRVEVRAQGLEELGRVARLALPVHHPRDPGRLVGLALLVEPVRGHPELGRAVHRVRADLDLERLALGAEHGGVEALVHVRLGHRDQVLEPPGQGLPERVDDPHRPVAVLHRVRPSRASR